jgi:hypothetical protein
MRRHLEEALDSNSPHAAYTERTSQEKYYGKKWDLRAEVTPLCGKQADQ